ncbi:hypothetical protein CUMW_217430 [Citrus unshiu]|uniref:Dirigent protein n=1 Tax=Citrus unshiu TaxID=55188 RepID=A0A2H5QCN4_CITUN|nr:hypothetical protein CUMW_217430 [Citrus unshiu]
MAKLSAVVLLLISRLVAAAAIQTVTWATRLKSAKETTTNLQFYFHDTLSGKNPSAVRIAQAIDTDKSRTLFGIVMMADDPLTETPDPQSKLVGRAQGLYGSACQDQLSLIMSMSFVFVDGPYNGSSISLLGNNRAMNPVREMPIVGGTGFFRLARGYAVAQTHWMGLLAALAFSDWLADMQLLRRIGWILKLATPLLDTMLQLFTKLSRWSHLLVGDPIHNVINSLFTKLPHL